MSVKSLIFGFAAAANFAGSAQAISLVTNGGFETTNNGIGQFDYNTHANGWTSNGYNFLLGGNTADSVGSYGQYCGLSLWGPANGYNNGLGASPDGGNFAAADGAFGVAPIEQTLTGLVAGKNYVVKFYWAGAQQSGFTGTNNEQWQVSLGGVSQFTPVYHNTTGGFSGWFTESMTFTAPSTTAVLSFLAKGTPKGVPPFSLLDGVSAEPVFGVSAEPVLGVSAEPVSGVPETAVWLTMIAGFGLVGVAARRHRQTAVVA